MEKEKAYRVIAKHLFKAHRKYEGHRVLIILADSYEEATGKAVEGLGRTAFLLKGLIRQKTRRFMMCETTPILSGLGR